MSTMTAEFQKIEVPAATTIPSRRAVRVGRVLSGIAGLFLAFDAVVKVLALAPAVEGTIQLGFSPAIVQPLGVLLLAFVLAYAVSRTAVFGAVLLSGYLGGAVATHVRFGNPLFTHILSPIYVAVFLWVGLWLRDRRVRALTAR